MIGMFAALFLTAVADLDPAAPAVTCEAAASVQHVAPGVPFDVICTLQIPEGWHVYWEDPGASGMPTQIEMEATPDFTQAPTRYQRPNLLHPPEGTINTLEGEVTLVVPVTPSPELQPGSKQTLHLDVTWFVCKDLCFLGRKRVVLPIVVADAAGPPTAAAAKSRLLPQPIAGRPGTEARLHSEALEISGPLDVAGDPGFLPVRFQGAIYGDVQLIRDESTFHLRIPIGYDGSRPGGLPCHIRGLVTFGSKQSDSAWLIDLPCHTSAGEPDTGSEESE